MGPTSRRAAREVYSPADQDSIFIVESHVFELLGTQNKFKPLGQPTTFRLDHTCVLALVSPGTDTHCFGSVAPEGGGVGSKGSLCALPTLPKALGSPPRWLLGVAHLLQGLLTPAQQQGALSMDVSICCDGYGEHE